MTFERIGNAAARVTNELAEKTQRVKQFPQEDQVSQQVAKVEPQEEAVPVAASETAAVLSMIERVARDSTVDISRLERLMEMRERIVAQNAKKAYFAALAEMQPQLPVIGERGEIKINKDDKKPGQRYALWEDINEGIRPVLAEHGFAISFRTNTADGKVSVTGILSHREGHAEETTMQLPVDTSGSKNAVQAVGSSTSYGKRYVAMALLNLTSGNSEDDDGEKGGGPPLIDEDQLILLRDGLEAVSPTDKKADIDATIRNFCSFLKVQTLADIPAARFEEAKSVLDQKRKVAAK